VLAQDIDLLHPPAALEARKHKLKRLVQSPNSFFMDVKCQVRPRARPTFSSRARGTLKFTATPRAHPPASDDARADARSPLLSSPPRNYQGCFNITTVFSHSQTVVLCGSCSAVLCQPTGGRARLTEGCSFRRKGD
jgi:small subunit ribosomal protein S27e